MGTYGNLSACSVRRASRKDLNEIQGIELKSFNYPYSKLTFLTLLVMFPELFLVAVCDNKVVGYVTGAITKEGYCHLFSIAVDPSYRGKGLGGKLLRAFEEVCLSKKVKKVILEVSVINEVALNLYKKHGYRVVKTIPNYYPDSDAYLMEKDLNS